MTTKKKVDHLVDRGCWISDDRVYAFVTARGITEAGYHGTQPVSRNSRMLVREDGVILPALRMPGGSEAPVDLREVTWDPGGVAHGGVGLRASGRTLRVSFDRKETGASSALIRIPRGICFSGVHGERSWKPALIDGGRLRLACRDLIMFRPWFERTGAYAGDFLLPEELRRKIFAGNPRSGRGMRADLRPEYRDADFPVYDAAVTISFGGDHFRLAEEKDGWVFEGDFADGGMDLLEFRVTFGDGEDRDASPAGPKRSASPLHPPSLTLKGFPRLGEFLRSIPALVDSCVVTDLGVPRACPGRYYWIWAWDMLVTGAEALRWGENRLAGDIVRFAGTHRDEGGAIPARWTRSLLPLDTPSRGGIDYLHAALALDTYRENGDRGLLSSVYGGLRELYDRTEPEIRRTGAVAGEGFYPDLLEAFGRTRESAVAMEVGSWYCLTRHAAAMARVLGETEAAGRMEEGAAAIADGFDKRFWDGEIGFYRDAAAPGPSSRFHPLFSLLFLHSSAGFALVRKRVARAAAFVDQQFFLQYGMRTLPLNESTNGGEVVLDSWYPHWDVYGLKLLRRAGRGDAIMRWLRRCEETLGRLGYCPEFLSLRGFREGREDAWTQHGSASNLNCVTAWSRGIREAVFGIDIDQGGITHIPLALPLGELKLHHLRWKGGNWTIDIDNRGPLLDEILVDGRALVGVTKIPVAYATPGNHRITIRYGNAVSVPYFEELVDAEVLSAGAVEGVATVRVRGTGPLDGTFFSPRPPALALDGISLAAEWNARTGRGFFEGRLTGEHELTLG
jgi:hypothetical protein